MEDTPTPEPFPHPPDPQQEEEQLLLRGRLIADRINRAAEELRLLHGLPGGRHEPFVRASTVVPGTVIPRLLEMHEADELARSLERFRDERRFVSQVAPTPTGDPTYEQLTLPFDEDV